MKNYRKLSGIDLEKWFKDFLTKQFGFKNYFPSSGNIQLAKLDPTQTKGHNLELDGIMLIGETLILFEYTSQKKNPKEKIKSFTRNCNLYINSGIPKREKLKFFGIPENQLDDFEEAKRWKFVYFGTADELSNKKLTIGDFPDFPDIQKELYIFSTLQLDYWLQLSSIIGKFTQNEFLAALKFSPEELGENKFFSIPFIKGENKFVTTSKVTGKADIYLFKAKVEDLLKVARVSRYEGIPFIFENDDNKSYQRLLIPKKIDKISNDFIENNKRVSFPNTITLILSSDCKENKNELNIPIKYSSIDIIDGQHRLFAYTQDNIEDLTRKESEIFATGIKFSDHKNIDKNAAKIFVEINSNQAKVKNNLIYLIKYDVLGDRDYKAIAGKILLEVNKEGSNKALHGTLLTNSLKKKNSLGHYPIPITTIVNNDLVPFLKGIDTKNKKEIDELAYQNIFGNTKKYYKDNPEQLWKKGKQIISQYFNLIKRNFNSDWKLNANTYMQSSKYYSALIRYLRYILFDKKQDIKDLAKNVKTLKSDLSNFLVRNEDEPIFCKDKGDIPSTKFGIPKIFEFLKKPSSQFNK